MPTPITLNNFSEQPTVDQLGTLEDYLQIHQAALLSQDNEQIKTYLYNLLTSLHDARYEAGLGAKPELAVASALSTQDIVALLLTEMRKTKNALMTSAAHDIRTRQKVTTAENTIALEKIQKAIDDQGKANILNEGLAIAKWCMLAVSVLLLIVSVVATVCTFGAASPAIGVSIAMLCVSAALMAVSYIPVDKSGNTAFDKMSAAISKGIANIELNNRKGDIEKRLGKKWDELTDEQQQEELLKAEKVGSDSALGINIAIQVIIFIIMTALTIGTCAASSAGNLATSGAQVGVSAGTTTVRTANGVALAAVKAAAPSIASAARGIGLVGQLGQGAGKVAASSVGIVAAKYTYDSQTANAEAQKSKAYVAYIMKLIEQNEEFLEELLALDAENAQAVANIIATQHSANRKIAENFSAAA